MEQSLAQFAHTLRAAGVPVSTAEVMDCLAALPLVDNFDRSLFKTVLQSHLIKSRRDLSTFNSCFSLFFDHTSVETFAGTTPALPASNDNIREKLAVPTWQTALSQGAEQLELTETGWEVVRFLTGADESLLERIDQVQRGNIAGLTASSPASGMQGLSERLRMWRAIAQVRGQLERFITQQISEFPEQRALMLRWQNRQYAQLRILEDMLTGQVGLEVNRLRIIRESSVSAAQDQDRNLAEFFNADRQKLFELMQHFIRKITTAQTLRQRQQHYGHINIKKTFRESLQYGGIPLHLRYQRKNQHKGDLVVLCDVSGSVYGVVAVTLTMIYALASQFRKIRSFVFVDSLLEITDDIAEGSLDQGLRQVMESSWFQTAGASNYGQMLLEFSEKYLRLIGSRSTVLILGDARNNGNATAHHILEVIYKKARRLIWLNPENSRTWFAGDSEVRTYLPFCSEFRECRTFQQLKNFIESLR